MNSFVTDLWDDAYTSALQLYTGEWKEQQVDQWIVERSSLSPHRHDLFLLLATNLHLAYLPGSRRYSLPGEETTDDNLLTEPVYRWRSRIGKEVLKRLHIMLTRDRLAKVNNHRGWCIVYLTYLLLVLKAVLESTHVKGKTDASPRTLERTLCFYIQQLGKNNFWLGVSIP